MNDLYLGMCTNVPIILQIQRVQIDAKYAD